MKKHFLLLLLWGIGWPLAAQQIAIDVVITDLSCNGSADGAITTTVTGGTPPYEYRWSTGSVETSIIDLIAATYSLTVTDANSLSATGLYPVGEPSAITVISSITEPDCPGGDDGSITAQVAGGTPPYEYQWSNGVSIPEISDLFAGAYVLNITDNQGCVASLEVILDDPAPIVLQTLDQQCETATGSDGQIEVSATGGTLPYTYLWNDGGSGSLRTDLAYGGYRITITDDKGCTQTPDPLYVCHEAMLLPDSQEICRFESVSLEVFAPDAQGYDWTPEEGLSCVTCPNPTADPQQTTEYTILINPPTAGLPFEHRLTITVDSLCVWPGDIDSSGWVSQCDLLPIGLSFGLSGPSRTGGSNEWGGQPADDWNSQIPGLPIDNKHVDANGDGQIDADDLIPLVENWGEEVGFIRTDLNDPAPLDTILMAVDADTLVEGTTIRLPIILGSDAFPADSVYGVCFSLYYDAALFEAGTARVEFDSSWLGTLGADLIQVQRAADQPGIYEVGVVRTDGQDQSGIGAIGYFIITVEDDILLRRASGDQRRDSLVARFDLREIRLINAGGEVLFVQAPSRSGRIVADRSTGLVDRAWSDRIRAFPNPSRDQVTLVSRGPALRSATLYNALGQQRGHWGRLDPHSARLDTRHLSAGAYYLRVRTAAGIWQEIIIIEE